MAAAAVGAWLAANAATIGTVASIGLGAEGLRKGHVGGRIAEKQQKSATDKAEKKAKDQEARNTAVSQAAAKKAKLTQKEAVTKSPFAGKPKGNLRKQFTVGGGGSGSGTNY